MATTDDRSKKQQPMSELKTILEEKLEPVYGRSITHGLGNEVTRAPREAPPQRECGACGGQTFYVYGHDDDRPVFRCASCQEP